MNPMESQSVLTPLRPTPLSPFQLALADSSAMQEWLRVRLSLALEDARSRRLSGVIGQYRALYDLDPDMLPASVCDGYRAVGTLLEQAGFSDLSLAARQVAALTEAWVEAQSRL